MSWLIPVKCEKKYVFDDFFNWRFLWVKIVANTKKNLVVGKMFTRKIKLKRNFFINLVAFQKKKWKNAAKKVSNHAQNLVFGWIFAICSLILLIFKKKYLWLTINTLYFIMVNFEFMHKFLILTSWETQNSIAYRFRYFHQI